MDKFSKNTQISNFMQIRPMGAELFHVDRQTELINAFRNFANAPKMIHHFYHIIQFHSWKLYFRDAYLSLKLKLNVQGG